MQEGFVASAWTAMVFFRFCSRYKITEEKDRLAVLRELTRRKKASYVRDPQAFLEGKRVLKIKKKDETK